MSKVKSQGSEARFEMDWKGRKSQLAFCRRHPGIPDCNAGQETIGPRPTPSFPVAFSRLATFYGLVHVQKCTCFRCFRSESIDWSSSNIHQI